MKYLEITLRVPIIDLPESDLPESESAKWVA